MTVMLDPWRDAATIAQRLTLPGNRLVLVLGAEAWCQKCRQLRPAFDQAAARAHPNDTWLWLDLEDHAEFLGDYIPDDLPLLLVYAGPTLQVQRRVDEARDLLDWQSSGRPTYDPGVRERLLIQDWAF
ncbi:thioredoxin family protein [Chitinimonas lacunae]|uniref:Thioredoxin family protein n=1 Tax=Chitinimonas lacunae TaxID=1963018 RepID=A0ABV8MWI3_9NEIS